MKALVKWFEGVDIVLPFVSIKFKKPNTKTELTLANATGLNKMNNLQVMHRDSSLKGQSEIWLWGQTPTALQLNLSYSIR